MKRRNKTFIVIGLVLVLGALLVGCWGHFQTRKSNHFVYFIFSTRGDFSVSQDPQIGTVTRASAQDTVAFLLQRSGETLRGKDYIQLTGWEEATSDGISNELKDWGYYRKTTKNFLYEIDRREKEYNKYYIPNMPIYWSFSGLTISSGDTSFGEDFPPGSDLTPLFTFYFPSLKEFIDNGYKGDYTTEHAIQANDLQAWRNLVLFENLGRISISKIPTAVQGSGKPSVTLSLQFIDKASTTGDKKGNHNQMRHATITLLLDIEE